MYDLKSIVEQTGADSAAIMAPHPTEPFLVCLGSYNMPPEWDELKNPLDDSTMNGKVFVTAQPIQKDHLDVDFHGHFIGSVLVVPIIKNNKTIGTLELMIYDKNKSFGQNAQKDAEEFAKTFAILQK